MLVYYVYGKKSAEKIEELGADKHLKDMIY